MAQLCLRKVVPAPISLAQRFVAARSVALMDDRFTRPGVRSLLAGWWRLSQRRVRPSPSNPADAPSGAEILY